MASQVTHDAELIYNYHHMHHPLPRTADAIFCLCSLDLRVARRAAQLFLNGHARWLIFSGGSGKLTANHPAFRGATSEAEVFAQVAAEEMGVPREKIVVEGRSGNTGENVRFTWVLLRGKGLLWEEGGNGGGIRSFILVQKPYMERRTFATFMKQWPGQIAGGEGGEEGFDFTVTSPELDFKEYPDEDNPRELVIHIMVGDLVRTRDYAEKGYQIPQDIPEEVWEAGQRLIAAGYTQHLP